MDTTLDDISLERLRKGDKRTWDSFVTPAAFVMRPLIRRILNVSGREDDTSDVLQEAFVRVCQNEFRALQRFDPTRAKLSTWVGAIAIHAALDYVRRKQLKTVELNEVPGETFAVSNRMIGDNELDFPKDLLTPRQALILKLLYEDDWEVAQVASHLQIEEQTVRSMHHKALERLRKYFKKR